MLVVQQIMGVAISLPDRARGAGVPPNRPGKDRWLAEELFIAEGAVRTHVGNIYEIIAATNRAEATRYALNQGLV